MAFPKGSVENKILEKGLIKPPVNAVPEPSGECAVAIAIPAFRYKNPQFYNYLPRSARADLLNAIRDSFTVQLWADVHKAGIIGKSRKDIIYDWMAVNGIEASERNWNAIAKIYQRQVFRQLGRRFAETCLILLCEFTPPLCLFS